MKPNLFCTILACTTIMLGAEQSAEDILERFLSKDLLFRDECVNNYNNDDCATIRHAILTQYKYGRAIRYLENNEEYLATEYRSQINPQVKKPFIPFSSRNPKIKNIHDALIVKYVSEKIFADKDVNDQLDVVAKRLIMQSTASQPNIDKNEQLELVGQSLQHALDNQSQEKI